MTSVLKKTKANASIVQIKTFFFLWINTSYGWLFVLDLDRINQNAHDGAHVQYKENMNKHDNKTKLYYINKNDIYYRQGIIRFYIILFPN